MSRRQRNRRDKRAESYALHEGDEELIEPLACPSGVPVRGDAPWPSHGSLLRENAEPDTLTTTTGQRIDLRAPWPAPQGR